MSGESMPPPSGQALSIGTPGRARESQPHPPPGGTKSTTTAQLQRQPSTSAKRKQTTDDDGDVFYDPHHESTEEDLLARVVKAEGTLASVVAKVEELHEMYIELKASLRAAANGDLETNVGSHRPHESASTENARPTISTVWSSKLNEAVKSAGALDKLIHKPAQAKPVQSRMDTLIVFGIAESGANWDDKRVSDKRAVQQTLASIDIDSDLVVSTYRFNSKKGVSSSESRRPTPVRIFLSSKSAADEIIRKAHKLQGSEFSHVFFRRDLSKEDLLLDREARAAR